MFRDSKKKSLRAIYQDAIDKLEQPARDYLKELQQHADNNWPADDKTRAIQEKRKAIMSILDCFSNSILSTELQFNLLFKDWNTAVLPLPKGNSDPLMKKIDEILNKTMQEVKKVNKEKYHEIMDEVRAYNALKQECEDYDAYLRGYRHKIYMKGQLYLNAHPKQKEKVGSLDKKLLLTNALTEKLKDYTLTIQEKSDTALEIIEADRKGNNYLKLPTGTENRDRKFWERVFAALKIIAKTSAKLAVTLGLYAPVRGHRVGSWQFWKSRKQVFAERVQKQIELSKKRR